MAMISRCFVRQQALTRILINFRSIFKESFIQVPKLNVTVRTVISAMLMLFIPADISAMPAIKAILLLLQSINDDLRHCIPILRCGSAVLKLFLQAYNDFAVAKMNFRINSSSDFCELPFTVLDLYNMRRVSASAQHGIQF